MDQKSGDLVTSFRKGSGWDMMRARPCMMVAAVRSNTLSSKLEIACMTTGARMKSLVCSMLVLEGCLDAGNTYIAVP